MNLTTKQLVNIIKEELQKVIQEKDDRCTRIAKRKYDVWPSAYASGAVVKCRQGKIWKGIKETLSEEDFKPHMMYNPKNGESIKAKTHADHVKLAKKGYTHVDPDELAAILDKEGGAAGLDPMVKGTGSSEKEIKNTLKSMPDVGKHEKGDYIKADDDEIEVKKEMKKNCGCGQDPCITHGPQAEPAVVLVKEFSISEASYDDGSPVEESFEFYETMEEGTIEEAEYRGRKVKLNKPMRGDVKKFKVYVKDPKTGNIKKVNFGDKKMRIKKSNPKRRKSFRARHNCDNPGPKTKARYWSCRKW